MIRSKEIPVLPECSGSYEETPPTPALGAHFQCVWVHSVSEHHSGRIAVVPDGCVDLLWRNDRFTVVGPDITAANPDLKPGDTILGIRFKPGAAHRWLRLSMAEIVGREFDMEDIWGRKAHDIAETLRGASDGRERIHLLQRLLLRMASQIEHPAHEAAAIFHLTQGNTVYPLGGIPLIRDTLGLSERTLRRKSDDFFGYGPKTLHRILRFQRFQTLARSGHIAGLGNMAMTIGYADQAHLSREIRELCGMTAREFVRQLSR